MELETFKKGIFALNNPGFGTVAKLLIRQIFNLKESRKITHDLISDNSRVEVKFSRVNKRLEVTTEQNILRRIEYEAAANRRVTFHTTNTDEFSCMIQHIKKEKFDFLYYGLFFDNCIKIFKIPTEEIGSNVSYSQHKLEDGGQFPLNEKNLDFHIKNFLVETIDYSTLYNLLLDNSMVGLEKFYESL
jgi:hypothetical protein